MASNAKHIKTVSTAKKEKNPFNKDTIYHPMSQWVYPDKVTKIPSRDITIQGVPYGVPGIYNSGNQQIMHPNIDYGFPGYNVTEHPSLRKGGLIERSLKSETSKNIKESINRLVSRRNELVFGPSVRKYFKPFQKGGDYNENRVKELGIEPDVYGHYPSVDPTTGMWLKSKKHPTAWMEYLYGYTLDPELNRNYQVIVNPEGYFGEDQLQYVPKKTKGGNSNSNIQQNLQERNSSKLSAVNKKHMDTNKKIKNVKAFPQQPEEEQFFTQGWIPSGPIAFYMHGGVNTNMLPFPQQPNTRRFFKDMSGNSEFAYGGAPCFECGGAYMNQGGFMDYKDLYDNQYGGNVTLDNADNEVIEMYKKGGNWIQAANKKMKAKGTKGAFTEYCGGKVTEECIQRGLNSPDPTIRKRAAFAKAMRKIHKAKGGESPQGYNIDNVLDANKNKFKAFLTDNTINALQDELEQELFNIGGNNFNYSNQEKLDYANQMIDRMNKRGQMINQDFWEQTANIPSNMRAFDNGGSNSASANTPSYLTKEDLDKYFQEKFGQQQQYGYPQGYGYGQPVYYYRGQGMQGYFPMNPMGPYYKTKFKGWSNVPTTYGIPKQYVGTMSGAPSTSGEMTEEQKEAYRKYWADRGVNAEIHQDVKRGLLGKWLGPRRVKTSVKFSVPGQNSGTTNSSQHQSNFSNYPTTTDKEGGYDFVKIGSTPVNKEQFMQGKINQDLQMMNPNFPTAFPAPQSGIPYGEPNMMTVTEGWNKYGGLNMFGNGGAEAGDTAGPLEWGFDTVEKRKIGFSPGTADWIVGAEYAGANLLGNTLGANYSEKKAMENWMRSKQGADANYYAMQMDKGDHTKDVYSTDTLMPDQIGVKVEPWAMGQFHGNIGSPYYQGRYGGAFIDQNEPIETYMTDEEIKQFMAMGGRVEFLD